VSETYGRDSQATLLRKLSDPYIKAIRWASDRIGEEGIVAFVTNSSFVSEMTFDGMRKHLAQDFDAIYILDLGGNVRKNPKLSGTTHNVFGIQVGVSINILVRRRNVAASTCHPEAQSAEGSRSPMRRDSSLPAVAQNDSSPVGDVRGAAKIYYASVDPFWRKEQKYDFLDQKQHIGNVEWREIQPDARHNWLTEGMSEEFDTFIPLGTKAAKRAADVQAIFQTFSLGVSTNRDSVVYGFDKQALAERIEQFCDDYNAEVARYTQKGAPSSVDSFVKYDAIKWSRNLKRHLRNGDRIRFALDNIRESVYRPFTKQYLYFSDIAVDEPGTNQRFFPNSAAEAENRIICANQTAERPFTCLIADRIPNLVLCGGFGAATQCFPFYTYDEDGSNRRENVTDWALAQFRAHYADETIGKWDVFHYVYALLHHPAYRQTYAANLRRELPRVPFAPDFWGFSRAGAALAALHVGYEEQPEYPLTWVEDPDAPLSYHVERMRLSRDKTQLAVNDFLTLGGIPPAAFEYRLGHRSALEWVIDQYQVSTDKRSGIGNDPNRPDDPQYIVRLIGRVVAVSLETVRIVNGLPGLA